MTAERDLILAFERSIFMSLNVVLISIPFLLGITGGGIVLQIVLSRLENRWFGLILPLLTLVGSVILMLNIVVFDSMAMQDVIVTLIMSFFIGNIPTMILLAIYFICRRRFRSRRQMEKMRLQDLS